MGCTTSQASETALAPGRYQRDDGTVVIVIESRQQPQKQKPVDAQPNQRKPLLHQESVKIQNQAKIDAERKAQEAQKSIDQDSLNNIKQTLNKGTSHKSLSKQHLDVQGSSRRLQEFAPRDEEEEEVELEYDATTKKFIVKKNGEVANDDEASKYVPGSQQGDSELVWDATKKKYVVKGGGNAQPQQVSEKEAAEEKGVGVTIQAEESQEVAKPKPLHKGIMCVSCAKSPELLVLALLVGALNAEHKCIQGVRYMSAAVKGLNICEACEKIGHLISAGPYFKITNPDDAPIDGTAVVAEIVDPELRIKPGYCIHVGVRCDGCKMSEKLCLISKMCGRNIEGVLVGTRYKSAKIQDFDLCEVCESSELFDEKCGPFLKIEVPCVIPLIMTSYEDGSVLMVQ